MSLFLDQTFETILARVLARVPSTIDKREGSIMHNSIAPAAAELAQLYISLDFVFSATYAATAPREYLVKRAQDRGLAPYAASAAVFRAEFNVDVPIGARFSCGDLNFAATERMPAADTLTAKSYKVVCETAGTAANGYSGALIPIEYIDGLTSANLVELLVPGDDEEDTEAFRARYIAAVRSQAFGGNQADYKAKVLAIDGVSAVKVYPAWNGDIIPADMIPNATVTAWIDNDMQSVVSSPDVKAWITSVASAATQHKLTVGGSVKIVIMAAGHSTPSTELIDMVQTAIDPVQNAGEGLGLAPIGHNVYVSGVETETINVVTSITYAPGWSWDAARNRIEGVIDAYFDELAESWGDGVALIVRISQMESRILSECAAMVLDIADTRLNGRASNIILDDDKIPVRGVVNGT